MKWIVFTNKKTGKQLAKISKKELFPNEIEATIALLAYENNLKEKDIEIKL